MIKNILYLNSNSSLGGAERSLITEIMNLDKIRFFPTVGLFYEGSFSQELKNLGIAYEIFPASKTFLRSSKENFAFKDILYNSTIFLDILRLAISIRGFLKQKQVHLVVSNSFKAHFITAVLRLSSFRRVVWHYRDLLPENKFLKNIILLFARFIPRKILCNSSFVKNQFLQFNIKPGLLETVYPFFSLNDFLCPGQGRADYRRKFHISENHFAVGVLGALVSWKGQEYLIRAAKLLSDKIPDLKVLIVGDKIYDTDTKGTREYLEELTKELGLEDKVFFTGFINNSKKIINALDIVVHTSIKPEPFGRVIVEAMLCAKPVIATMPGGAAEIISDHKTGRLIAPGNAPALAEAILELYNDSEKREEMAGAGYRYAIHNFDISRRFPELVNLYLRILNSGA